MQTGNFGSSLVGCWVISRKHNPRAPVVPVTRTRTLSTTPFFFWQTGRLLSALVKTLNNIGYSTDQTTIRICRVAYIVLTIADPGLSLRSTIEVSLNLNVKTDTKRNPKLIKPDDGTAQTFSASDFLTRGPLGLG